MMNRIGSLDTYHVILGVIEDLEIKIPEEDLKGYYTTGKIHDLELMEKINENYEYLAAYILEAPMPCKEEKKPQKEEKPVEKPPVFLDRSSAVAVDPGCYIPDTWIEIGEENRALQGYETSVTPVF